MNSYLNGQQSVKNTSIFGRISADRVTPDWKLELSSGGSYNERIFVLDSVTTITDISRNQNFNALIVKSISDHWSTGMFSNARSSTFDNYDLQFNISPAIEYNLAKGHFDMQKKATKAERTIWTRNMCVLGMKNGIPKSDCCNWVVQLANGQGISNENSIREVCDKDFKNEEMSSRKLAKTFESKGKDTKEIKKLKKVAGEKYADMEARKLKLETENTQYQKEIIGLREDNVKTMNINEDLNQQLRLVANIHQDTKCKKCGTFTELKVDASTGKVLVSDKK